ncbi:MAG: sodium/solute symporter [Prevotellaceae bacterium]|jgi:SSS family solute:Na+ symporter|nr:sodium/solute symporter [Prevotellaceae bacterium]
MRETVVKLTGLDISVIVAFVVLLFGVAYWASFVKKKKRGESMFLAGKTLGWFSIGLTMWGTNVGPSVLVASASSGFEGGIAAGNFSWYAFPFIFLLTFVFAPRYLGAGISTLPEFMGKRFGDRTRSYIAWYSIVTIVISWLGLTLFSGGVFMEQILGLPMWLCIVILVAVSAAFAVAGGLRAIAYTNVFQMLLLIGVSALLTAMAIYKVGGFTAIAEKTPPEYWNLFKPMSDADFPWLAIILGYPIMGVWFWCTDQSMVQSVLGAKNLRQGQLGANFTAWLKLLDIPLFILPGILCFLLTPNLTSSTDAYLNLVKAVFPIGLIGLVVVVMIAALVSTIGSALNSLSAVFTMDIYAKRFKPGGQHDGEFNKVGRIVTLAGAVLSVFLAMAITQIQGLSFFNIFQSVLGFIAPPMSAAFLFSVFWKRTTTRAVNLILTAGTVFSIGTGILYYTGVMLTGIHFLLISFGIFVALSAAIALISLLAPEAAGQQTGADVAVAYKIKKPARAVLIPWIALIAVMVIMYIIFNGW